MRIKKALVIDEPWISKILRGEKVWEMRSTNTSNLGPFGLIRKGSGQVVGVAYLTKVSGPFSNEELIRHFDNHQVPESMIVDPDYKWRYAWHLEDVEILPVPAPYIHKSGAVTWVELDDNAQRLLSGETVHVEESADIPVHSDKGSQRITRSQDADSTTVLSPRYPEPEGSIRDSYKDRGRAEESVNRPEFDRESGTVKPADNRSLNASSLDKMEESASALDPSARDRSAGAESGRLLPRARDGSVFTPATANGKGIYTVGKKGDEQKFTSFDEALEYLRRMPTAMWRRPNAKGNWGIVSAVDWVSDK